MSKNDTHEFSSIWKWIRCCNDVMNNVDCVIKRDVYPQKMHSCSENILGISLFVLKLSGVWVWVCGCVGVCVCVCEIGVIAWLFR